MKKCKATAPGFPEEHIDLSPEEQAAREAEDATWADPATREAKADLLALKMLDGAIHKTVRDALWDFELRMRAAGQLSNDPEIAAATTKVGYTTILKDRVKTYL